MSHPLWYTRRTKDKENEMKRLLYKHLLRAKYMVNKRFFWKLSTAIAEANKSYTREIVWSIDYKKVYDNRMGALSIHPDAANFNPFQ
jgi:hypothetical protein